MKIKLSKRKNTIRSFIEKWPELYKTQALQNTKLDVDLMSEWSAPSEVLAMLFIWNETTQGGYYWHEFYKTLTL